MPTYYQLTSDSSIKKTSNYLKKYDTFFRSALDLYKKIKDEDLVAEALPEHYIQSIYKLQDRDKFYVDSIFNMLSTIPFKAKLSKLHPGTPISCPMLEIPYGFLKLSDDKKTITCKYGKLKTAGKFKNIDRRSRFFLCKDNTGGITLVVFTA